MSDKGETLVGPEEYHRAIDLAERVVKWVEEQIPGVAR
jgi:hypothetical protein